MDFDKLLMESWERAKDFQGDPNMSKYELVASIFELTTYCEDIDKQLVKKAMSVCSAITKHTTYTYIQEGDNELWYITVLNFPFFANKIDWGTSIRGAWWDRIEPVKLENICWAWWEGEQLPYLYLGSDEWLAFLEALEKFLKV